MDVFNGLEPVRVFHYFEEISQIPRTSHHTQLIGGYLEGFAKKHGLSCLRDAAGNVLIRKAASDGYENAPTVILQGHMDMVGDKRPGSAHDFMKDPLELFVEGDEIGAKDTTLGGDDGIAVAYACAILEDDKLCHPPLEVLLTVDEEVGLLGAAAFDTSLLKGRLLLNLDSEEEGVFTCGCAGGLTENTSLKLTFEAAEGLAVTVSLDGLQGGHSGQMINEGRGNADKLLTRFLYELLALMPCRLSTLEGGAKDNAIPFRASAELLIEEEDLPKLQKAAAKFEKTLRTEYSGSDDGVTVSLTQDKVRAKRVMTDDCRDKILAQMMNMPYGVIKMNRLIPGLVETSSNVGIMKIEEDSFMTVSSIRSSVESERDTIRCAIESLSGQIGGNTSAVGIYPPWVYREHSSLRDRAVSLYREMYGKEPVVDVIHAGLECGLFDSTMEGLDAISYGPDMKDIHTFRERLSISSVSRVWEFTLKILASLR